MILPKRFWSLLGTLVLVALAALLTLLIGNQAAAQMPGTSSAAEWRVCPAGPPACDYATIQEAVDASTDGDIIKVAAGTYIDLHDYDGTRQVVYISRSVTLRGGYSPANWNHPDSEANPTVLDAQGGGYVLRINGWYSPTIEGLRLTGGNGAGVIAAGANANISDCRVYSNSGHGVYLEWDSSILSGNIISGNTAYRGGGVALMEYNQTTLIGNTIIGNMAYSGNSLREGGGVFIGGWPETNRRPTLISNTITGNTASEGGGVYVHYSSVTLRDNTIQGNTAIYPYAGGGGVHLYLTGDSKVLLQNNRVIGNQDDGVVVRGSRPVEVSGENNLIADHDGIGLDTRTVVHWKQGTFRGNNTGVQVVGAAYLTNTILATGAVGLSVWDNSAATLNGVLWFDNHTNTAGAGIITVTHAYTGNPAFAPDGYHLTALSAAIDRGVLGGLRRDIDGQFRPMGMGCDLGADEYAAPGLDMSKAVQWALPFPPNPGQPFTYTVAITGVEAANTGVVVTDSLPAVQRALTAQSSAGNCTIQGGWGGSVRCAPGNIDVGGTIHITISAEFSPAAQPGVEVVNTVILRSNETANQVSARTYAQDCHVRLNNDPHEYTHIQAAVDAAGPGSLVKIAGVCLGVDEREGMRQQVYLDKALTLRGGYRADLAAWNPAVYPTVLDARRQGRVLYLTGDATVEYLQITGGDATGLVGDEWARSGGGVHVDGATATLRNNLIFSNTAEIGAGLRAQYSDITLKNNLVLSNTAEHYAGTSHLSLCIECKP